MTIGSEELHFRIAFCSTLTFAENDLTIASKTNYETAIHNSVEWFSSHEKMIRCFFQTTIVKLSKSFTLPIDKNILKQKQNRASFYYNPGQSI